MSITGFESAIQNNVKSYGDNLALLRDNSIMQRNNALAGLKGEFEKYGEIAKIGLELPVAIEGVKGIAGRAGDLYNFISKGGAKDALDQVRGKVEGAVGDIRDTMAGRLDNLRDVSAYGDGESKVDFNPMLREVEPMGRAFNDIEMTETDDPNYFETRAGGNDFSYGGSVGGESKVMSGLDEYGLPRRTGGNPLFDRGEEPRFSTTRGLDASWENGRAEPSVASMGKQPRGVANPESRIEQYSRPEASPEGRDLEMRSYSAKAEGEIRPGSSVERTTTNTFGGDIAEDTSAAAAQSAVEESSVAGGLGDVVDAAAAAGAGEAAGAVEEAAGAGLLASGIFAPLGALLEGVGAATELGSVGAGVYGAVQSITDADKEEQLRNTPLPTIRQPTLDLGGRVAAPILA